MIPNPTPTPRLLVCSFCHKSYRLDGLALCNIDGCEAKVIARFCQGELAAKTQEAEQRLAEMQKDAERYRWLRRNDRCFYSSETIDTFISEDAAIEQEN